MYQPMIKDNAVKTLYRVKRAYQKPMTKILDELLILGLIRADKVRVCSVCQEDGNNGDCSHCYFNNEGKEGV
ncbi:MAG: hypothetical protein GY853_06045 [PVC group bacterium]|nr:hypothetical protein [PVC group bacterium]